MNPYYQDDAVTIYHGDCRDILPQLEPVDLVLTDPPYELGFMGKAWDKQGISFQPETWQILPCKPGAMMLTFGGTRTWHRIAVAIEDAGWEIRDTLMWLYGQGFPKSLNISKTIDKAAGVKGRPTGAKKMMHTPTANGNYDDDGYDWGNKYQGVTAPATPEAQLWQGYGTALKPAFEPIILAMKPLDGTFAQNALKHGVAGLNIDGSRIGTAVETWPRTRSYAPHQKQPGGKGRKTELTGAMPQGRFPANLILDEEAGQMLDEQSGVSKSQGGRIGKKVNSAVSNVPAGQYQKGDPGFGDSGGASRFFYCAKASKSERGEDNQHPTVKPLALLKYLCNLLKPPTGGVLLDPFMGSGTTLRAAKDLGRKAIGIEIEEKYCEIAAKRMSQSVMDLEERSENG